MRLVLLIVLTFYLLPAAAQPRQSLVPGGIAVIKLGEDDSANYRFRGKPVLVTRIDGNRTALVDLENGGDDRIPARLYRQLMRFGPQRLTRDLTLFHRALIDSGRAGWLRASGPAPGPGGPMDDIERSVRRVDALLGPSR